MRKITIILAFLLLAPMLIQAQTRRALVIGLGQQEDTSWNKINGDKDVAYVLEILSDAAAEVDYLKGYTDAMFLSGLILSGGNAAWRGNGVSRDVDDGILTANEISCLDLSGTDMVVLSACRSGRGGVTSEGLYGLQRGFKKAGAGTLVMTLWDVMDHVASEFMISFYEALSENWWDKRRAFESAKQEVRERYPEPADWAAFVLLD